MASPEVAEVVLETEQALLLRMVLQLAGGEYESRRERQQQGVQAQQAGQFRGRKPDLARQSAIVALRSNGHSVRQMADLAGCSQTWVKRVWASHKATGSDSQSSGTAEANSGGR